jgi:hypothetical protein
VLSRFRSLPPTTRFLIDMLVLFFALGFILANDVPAEPIHLSKNQALQLYQLTVQLNVMRAELFRECGCQDTHTLDVSLGAFMPKLVPAPLDGNNPLDAP